MVSKETSKWLEEGASSSLRKYLRKEEEAACQVPEGMEEEEMAEGEMEANKGAEPHLPILQVDLLVARAPLDHLNLPTEEEEDRMLDRTFRSSKTIIRSKRISNISP